MLERQEGAYRGKVRKQRGPEPDEVNSANVGLSTYGHMAPSNSATTTGWPRVPGPLGAIPSKMKPQQLPEITRFTHQSIVFQGTRGPWPVKAQCTVEIQARTLLPVTPESLSPGTSHHANRFGSAHRSRSVPRPHTEGRVKADVENTGRAKDQSEVFSFSIDDSLQKLQVHSSEPRHGKPRRGRRNFPETQSKYFPSGFDVT